MFVFSYISEKCVNAALLRYLILIWCIAKMSIILIDLYHLLFFIYCRTHPCKRHPFRQGHVATCSCYVNAACMKVQHMYCVEACVFFCEVCTRTSFARCRIGHVASQGRDCVPAPPGERGVAERQRPQCLQLSTMCGATSMWRLLRRHHV